MSETYVLDSFAVLALLGREAGSEEVSRLLTEARRGAVCLLMTWVNVGEVAYIVERRWGKERVYQALGALEATDVAFVAAERELTLRAAEIKAGRRLAYADAFAVALAVKAGAELVTGDPEFRGVQDIVTLRWLPHKQSDDLATGQGGY